MDVCTGIADRVDFTKVARPTGVRRFPFHVGIRVATLSTMCCSSALASLEVDSGAPR
jgi:hypothetical protein